jgi:hypothetical protein
MLLYKKKFKHSKSQECKMISEETISEKVNIEEFFGVSAGPG